MPSVQESQRAKLRSLLAARSMMHAHELREAVLVEALDQDGARAVEGGEIDCISRGVYQKRDVEIEEN